MTTTTWAQANREYLDRQLHRLRLLLQRRVLWLRRQWRPDAMQPYHGVVISEAQADRLLCGEDWEAEQRFYEEDEDAATLSRAIDRLSDELAFPGGSPDHFPAMEILSRTFGLSALERDVLLLCLAPQLDHAFGQLYGYVQDDATCKYATRQLAAELLTSRTNLQDLQQSSQRDAIHDCFLPESPLRRYCLITTSAENLQVGLDVRIVDYLRGVHRMDSRVALLLRPLSADRTNTQDPQAAVPLAAEHGDLAERLARFWETDSRAGTLPIINLVGPAGVGKRPVADAICRRLSLHPMMIDLRKLPTEPAALQETLQLLAREAALLQLAFYLNLDDQEEKQPAGSSWSDVVGWLDAPLMIGSRRRVVSHQDLLCFDVPKLSSQAQKQLWQQTLGRFDFVDDGAVEQIVQQFDFGPDAIVSVVRSACATAQVAIGNNQLTREELWQACRRYGAGRLETLAQRIEPCHTWDDIVLPEQVSQQLSELVAQVPNRMTVYQSWGFAEQNSRLRGITACFSGPSGCGKTMAAEILARQLQLDLYRIDLAGVISKYIGETEKNLRKVFEAAEQSGAVLFFDEADALFGKRTEVKDSHDRYANIEINYLLQRMEDYRGLAILATNRKSDLDRAFLRRLRFLVDFPFPSAASRRKIWQRVFPPQAPLDDLDYDALARLEIAGGNIKTISLNAAFLAAQKGTSIGMAEVMSAARREYAKIDKLTSEADFGTVVQHENQRRKPLRQAPRSPVS